MTRPELAEIFRSLGLASGRAVMIHSRLSGLGYLPNGAYDVIDAVLDVIGEMGTILVPSHSGQLTDPADWRAPAVPAAWVETLRAAMRPFDPAKTPIRNRGMLPDCLMRYAGVTRSTHPISSVAALGQRAGWYTETHPLNESEGPESPCFKLYQAEGDVLLLGVGLEACSALHTAEFIADCPYLYETQTVALVEDKRGRRFERLRKYPGDSSGFEKLRPELRRSGALREAMLGDYRITRVAARPMIDAACAHLKNDPRWLLGPGDAA
jgi:aminoglycoside 3-N-acetyltransferase